ncbi:hypothetical protein B0H11DRAFT_2208850 [Mycena galericulata]|nr:hypothetical protein B0H11DRAFT_2208850 [Mycena galericulata]
MYLVGLSRPTCRRVGGLHELDTAQACEWRRQHIMSRPVHPLCGGPPTPRSSRSSRRWRRRVFNSVLCLEHEAMSPGQKEARDGGWAVVEDMRTGTEGGRPRVTILSSASVLFLPPSCLPPFLCFLGLPLRLCLCGSGSSAYRPSSALASLAPSLHPVSKPRPIEAQAPHPIPDFPFSSSSPMPLASQTQAPTRCQAFIKRLKRSSSVSSILQVSQVFVKRCQDTLVPSSPFYQASEVQAPIFKIFGSTAASFKPRAHRPSNILPPPIYPCVRQHPTSPLIGDLATMAAMSPIRRIVFIDVAQSIIDMAQSIIEHGSVYIGLCWSIWQLPPLYLPMKTGLCYGFFHVYFGLYWSIRAFQIFLMSLESQGLNSPFGIENELQELLKFYSREMGWKLDGRIILEAIETNLPPRLDPVFA